MTEQELLARVREEIADAQNFIGTTIGPERAKALDYYLGRAVGDLARPGEGRSGVVARELADTVEWIMPSLMRIFASGDAVVVFEPQGVEDVKAAQQATEYVNWIFTRDNPGFLILYTLFKDALLQKNGIAKVWWEVVREGQEQTVERPLRPLSDIEAAAVRSRLAPEEQLVLGEPLSKGRRRGKRPARIVTKVTTRPVARVRIANVPPEEFLIARRARSIAEAPFCAHRVRRTVSDLIAQGLPGAKVEAIPSADGATDTGTEAQTRDIAAGDTAPLSDRPGAMREVWVNECYIRVDWDGDGIAELRRVLVGGDGDVLLENEPWETGEPCFVSLTPVIMPHQFFGLSIADLVMDLQLIKTAVWRQTLDNLYLTNHPRHVVSDQVNLDDFLTVRPGGIIRLMNGALPGQGHVQPLTVPFAAGASLGMLEYLDQVRENRTGVTRYNQGIDADALNKTATGITQIMSAAQQRLELIARVFAETGVKDLFRQILRCVLTHQDFARAIRLRNDEWVPIDPREWKTEFDMSVTVGLGTGNRDQMLAHLQAVLGIQVRAIEMQGGVSGPLVTLRNVHETLTRIAENAGLKPASLYFEDPRSPAAGGAAPARPDPVAAKAEADRQRAEADMALRAEKQRADLDLAMRKLQQDLLIARERIAADMQIARERLAAETAVKRDRLGLLSGGLETGSGAPGAAAEAAGLP